VRHGKAAPQDVGLSDFERVLTRAGAEECDRVAAKVSARKHTVDLMLSSPADRALETAHLFAGHFAYPPEKVQIAGAFYAADSIVPIIAQLKLLPDSALVVALCGHNPSLNELAAHLVRGFSQSLAKGAVAGVSLDISSWASLRAGSGQLLYLISPPERNRRPLRAPRPRAS
jgi:phosphohistidine phosphatase